MTLLLPLPTVPKKGKLMLQVYGPDIFDSIASGDLARMREVEKRAEGHLASHGNVEAALAVLKAEIARCERQIRDQS